jgi:hypothetical protein
MCARARSPVREQGYVAAGIGTMLRTARTLSCGQDLPTAVDEAFRQLAMLDTVSLQAAIAPIIKRGNIDAWQMRAPPGPIAEHCRHRPGPGRAAVAACSGRGVCLVAGRARGCRRVWRTNRRSCVIRVLPHR